MLRDRCRIIGIPRTGGPIRSGILHHESLSGSTSNPVMTGAGQPPLDEQELAALADAWGGGSIRKLERLIEGLIEIRERQGPRQ